MSEGVGVRAAAVRFEREFLHRDFPNRSVTMARRIGSTSLAMVLCTAGLGAFGLAGFSASSGRTLCSLIHGCPASESAVVTPVSNVAQKDGCAKSCSAKVETAATVTETKTCAAKASCAGKTCTGKQMVMGAGTAVAMPAAFYANTECKELQAASGCCKSGAKVETAATVTEKSSCSKSCSGAKVETAASVTEKGACAKTCGAKVETAATTTEKSGCCKSGAKVENAAAVTEKSACSKTCGAKVEAAATTTEKGACSKTCDGAKVEAAASTTEKAACTKGAACCKNGAKVENAAAVTEKKECSGEKSACCKGANVEVSAMRIDSDRPSNVAKKAGCCNSGAKVENAAATTEKSGCCKDGAKVENAAATTEKAACSKDSACCKNGAKVETAASTTEKKADDGCCKGSGTRADGGACCGKCDGKKVATKNWQPPY